jgi:gamma-D-glutamyl-L-lysine dipeptidyl-peptidase
MEQTYGVCRLSVIPVQNEPGNSMQVSQLLFGEAYKVLEGNHDKSWLHIEIYFDGTKGWINARHHTAISPEYFEHIHQADFKITTDIVSTILFKKNPLPILLGSIVPISSAELFKMDEQFAFNGEAKPTGLKREAEFIKFISLKYLHAPQTDGGKTPFGICPQGLTQMVFKISGYTLPWDLNHQMASGKKVTDVFSVQPGDLAFFNTGAGEIDHVGIVLDETRIIHAFGQVRIDQLNEEGILNTEAKVYSHSLVQIRRMLS